VPLTEVVQVIVTEFELLTVIVTLDISGALVVKVASVLYTITDESINDVDRTL